MKTNWMNQNVLKSSVFALTALSTFACSKDDDSSSTQDPNKQVLIGEITENKTISGSWSLDGVVTIKSGKTLTIEPGTTITSLVAKDDKIDILVVAQGAKLIAEGTAAKPIVFTSDAAESKVFKEQAVLNKDAWGGIVINGYAKINTGATGTGEYSETGTYGGTNDKDSSGSLKYVTLRYPGFSFKETSQLNGFSFYAVGSGTTLENLTVKHGFDDGFEFFGGTAVLKNARVEEVVDDAYDWTDGFTGTIENAVAILGNTSDKGIEGDNQGADNSATPQSNPTIKNMAIYGKSTSDKNKKAINIREGSKVTLENIYIFDVATALDFDTDVTLNWLVSTASDNSFKNINIDKGVATKFDANANGNTKLGANAEIKTTADVTTATLPAVLK